jgi:hypothetical protein
MNCLHLSHCILFRSSIGLLLREIASCLEAGGWGKVDLSFALPSQPEWLKVRPKAPVAAYRYPRRSAGEVTVEFAHWRNRSVVLDGGWRLLLECACSKYG